MVGQELFEVLVRQSGSKLVTTVHDRGKAFTKREAEKLVEYAKSKSGYKDAEFQIVPEGQWWKD